jgi:hypothetical protein
VVGNGHPVGQREPHQQRALQGTTYRARHTAEPDC